MPLRAQVDEREIQVWDLTGEQWSELKRASRTAPGRIRMACCGGHGAAKTSRSGNPFFAHRPQAHQALACRWAGESTAHAGCKLLAASGARAAGWRVRTEVAAADGSWRADVLCRRGSVRVALEIQLARSGLAGIRHRQERYREAGIRAAWFVPAALCPAPSRELPAFALAVGPTASGSAAVQLGGPGVDSAGVPARVLRLDRFVALLLRGAVRLEEQRILRPLACAVAVTAPDTCRRCGEAFEHLVGVGNLGPRQQPRYHVDGVPVTMLRDYWRIDRRGAWTLIGLVQGWRRVDPRLAVLAPRYCPIAGERYLMACCPRCGTGQGDGAVDRLLTSLHPRIPVRVPVPPAPLAFRPLDRRPPRATMGADWLEQVVPAHWRLEPGWAGDDGAPLRRPSPLVAPPPRAGHLCPA
jgi:hypothetical protein